MVRRIEFFYDLMSPYSHLAYWRLPGVAKRSAAAIILRPVSLQRLLALVGNPDPYQITAKRAYMQQDLEALGRYYGIPIEWPELGPQPCDAAMGLLAVMEGQDLADMSRRLFEAVWVEGIDLTEPEALLELVGPELMAKALSDAAQQQLEANTQEAFERGAFGVPSCFIGDRLFFGNERMFLLQTYLNG